MPVDIKIRPYAEGENNKFIDEFDEEEWDMITDLFERLVRNFKKVYPKVEITQFNILEKPFIYIGFDKEELLEEEIDYYIEVLTGFTADNILYFDEDEPLIIRGEIVLEEDSTGDNTLDKFNQMVQDLAPELAKKATIEE